MSKSFILNSSEVTVERTPPTPSPKTRKNKQTSELDPGWDLTGNGHGQTGIIPDVVSMKKIKQQQKKPTNKKKDNEKDY